MYHAYGKIAEILVIFHIELNIRPSLPFAISQRAIFLVASNLHAEFNHLLFRIQVSFKVFNRRDEI